MLPLVEFPLIVPHYAPWFESVFSPAAWIQFQRYLSGLLISENKTVEGINRLFVIESRHQSSLNRLLIQSSFSEVALNRPRLALLNSPPGTQVKPQGVLSVDDTLLTHYGNALSTLRTSSITSKNATPGRTTWSPCTIVTIKPTIRSTSRCGSPRMWSDWSKASAI